MEFFNNKNNNILKFKINAEGVDVNNIEPRLIFESDKNKNYIFYGKVAEGVCTFELPELQIYEKGDSGKVKFEIISEDLYFPVWKDDFEIKTHQHITLEKMVEDVMNEEKPKISAEYKKEFFKEPEPTKKVVIQPKIKTELVTEKTVNKEKDKVEEKIPEKKSNDGISKFRDFKK